MNDFSKNIDFKGLFNPKTIALIGATVFPNKWGFIVLANIIKGGYEGKIFPVNPNYDNILGIPSYASLSKIDEKVDLAIITTPAKTVLGIIDECIAKGIPNAIVITSNFSEVGEEGTLLEKEVVLKANAGGMNLVGPNTMGIYSSSVNLTALMPPINPLHGSVSMVSQSGNIGTQIMDWCESQGIGFSKFVSSGNEGDICCEDYLEYFGSDNETDVIVLYIESVKDGNRFLEIAKKTSQKKPIILFKGGKTNAGMSAAASHTGALAGSIDIYRTAFRQAGIIEAISTQEIVDLIAGFLSFPLPKGNRVGILTRGGGWGVITADECEANGLELPSLSTNIFDKFNKILPQYWSKGNPIDMVAVVQTEPFIECLNILASWKNVDSVISLGGMVDDSFLKSFNDQKFLDHMGISGSDMKLVSDQFKEECVKLKQLTKGLMDEFDKPIISIEIGNGHNSKENLIEHGFATYPTPERGVYVLHKLYEYASFRNRVGR